MWVKDKCISVVEYCIVLSILFSCLYFTTHLKSFVLLFLGCDSICALIT